MGRDEEHIEEEIAGAVRRARATCRPKYLIGTHEAYGEQLFSESDEVMPVIRQLFRSRNKLAHPKPGFGTTSMFEAGDEFEGESASPWYQGDVTAKHHN